ncbi:PREDICTED: mitochondrial inner membrane protein OXA1-like isoform X2 [Brassica oleracea var. oleracea]|uniref:mitochondrial inner membrane protein OXA1-like isoform X2 n=1 Tax=Brassica oleracea var. oleracea TaxID=109376 RepID=UPI0006A6EE96|nr:PREDICTED: mitochondrial inner membrane protein OXA1-like isoform X2 [Brassica oleracea var. oleracea]
MLHRQVFFKDRKKMSFAQPVCSPGVLLCRHISSSSKPEEWSVDALGDIVEGLVPKKSVEAMSTTIDGCSAAFESLYSPLNCVHYVINGIHDLTGCNWSMSVVLTALLASGLMWPVCMRIQRQVWELKILRMSIQKARRVMQTCDPKSLSKHKKWEAECTHKFGECYKSYLPLSLLNLLIFINGINTMAKKIPGFTDLSTLDSFYMLPLMTGLTFWFTSKVPTISLTKNLSRMKELPLYCIVFIVVQAAYKYEPAVYFYVITYKISLCTLTWMCRSKQIAKLSKRIMARVISVMREFIDVVKKKDKN